jgi:hypothetical protein
MIHMNKDIQSIIHLNDPMVAVLVKRIDVMYTVHDSNGNAKLYLIQHHNQLYVVKSHEYSDRIKTIEHIGELQVFFRDLKKSACGILLFNTSACSTS